MIPTTGTLRERVTQLVKLHRAEAKGKPPREIYRWVESPGPVTVREESIQGEASVELALPGGHEYLDLWLPTGLFEILLDDENADGAVLVVLPDGALEAHVIECKRTVDGTHWDKALRQMKWTLVKLRALAGALGAPIAGAVLYTAFREDRLSEEESPNPASAERIVGEPEGAAEMELHSGRQRQLGWMRSRVRLLGFERPFAHRKIPLDAAGRGGTTLAVGVG
jgi:hypothetical protein